MDAVTQHYQFKDHKVCGLLDENGEPWVCAKDVCEILGYSNHNEAIKYHCRKEGVANCYPLDTVGGIQYPTFINEGNLYRLIIKSKMPVAEAFEAWVCDQVLPSIRKHGFYGTPPDPYDDTEPGARLPLHRVQSALLAELRRMSKSLAQVYLLECGVTPAYIAGQLALIDGHPATGLDQDRPGNAMPLALFKQSIKGRADHQDERYFYFKKETFKHLCGDYDPTDTARSLRDKKLLKHYRHTLTVRIRPPKSSGSGKRLLMYAVNKAILDS